MRPAIAEDVLTLVDLMTDFYAESGYALDRVHAQGAFAAVLADARLGRVWIVQQGAEDVGYLVVTFLFGMEYGGLMAVVDDFYVRPASRNVGLGTAALADAREDCVRLGVRAISVQVGEENAAAQSVYLRTGLLRTDRQLMILGLAKPTHRE